MEQKPTAKKMKRHGNLFPAVIAFDNLLLAAQKAQKSKRYRANVLEFNHNLESEILQLQSELRNGTYQPGKYRSFRIEQPKSRLISAAPYRDRVVHHALCNIMSPILDRSLIYETYANRIAKGSHQALQQFTTFIRHSPYILQCDIKKFFPSIDHTILKQLLRHKIKCPDALWLIDLIIDSSNPQEQVLDYFPNDDLLTPCTRPKGLPIGNLTSQLFANYYLAQFDRFIKENLHCQKYLRYVDDFALFHSDRNFLIEAKTAIVKYLAAHLRLKIHSAKSQIFETRYGASFLGFRILSDRILVRGQCVRRARRRLKLQKIALQKGKLSEHQLQTSWQSYQAHLSHGDTFQLVKSLQEMLPLPIY